jgi:hypothetical protein
MSADWSDDGDGTSNTITSCTGNNRLRSSMKKPGVVEVIDIEPIICGLLAER